MQKRYLGLSRESKGSQISTASNSIFIQQSKKIRQIIERIKKKKEEKDRTITKERRQNGVRIVKTQTFKIKIKKVCTCLSFDFFFFWKFPGVVTQYGEYGGRKRLIYS